MTSIGATVCRRQLWVTDTRLRYVVAGFELDIAFPDRKVAIEVDGWAWHSDPDRFRRDRQRQNALVLAGWTVLRFAWHDLVHRPADVIRQIRAALDTVPDTGA